MVDVVERHDVSERRACGLVGMPRSTWLYKSRRGNDTALRMRLRDLAMSRPRYGYKRLQVLLRREGIVVNHKKVYRLYVEEGLHVRTKRRRKLTSRQRVPLEAPVAKDDRWCMDFMSDAVFDGRRFRVLTIIDAYTRESLATEVAERFTSQAVTDVLERIIVKRRQPQSITVDNGSEFTSRHFDHWAFGRGIRVDFIRPGRPMENGYIESFNGKLRDECLNTNWFQCLDDARQTINAWRIDYNETRPHSSLGNRSPAQFAAEMIWLGAG